MSLREEIQSAQKLAMKERKEQELSTLRLLWSQIQNTEIETKKELTDEEIQKIVASQVKQLRDSSVEFEKGGRADLATGVNVEITLLEKYLPEQLSDDELKIIVEKVLTDNNIIEMSQMGQAMGAVMKSVQGKSDGNRVKEMVSVVLKS